jgi:hypothetical protein
MDRIRNAAEEHIAFADGDDLADGSVSQYNQIVSEGNVVFLRDMLSLGFSACHWQQIEALSRRTRRPARRAGARSQRHRIVEHDYRDAVLEQLRSEGYPLNAEDVARLSPLLFDHINFLGRYAFALPDSVAHGQLRPLRSADTPEDE